MDISSSANSKLSYNSLYDYIPSHLSSWVSFEANTSYTLEDKAVWHSMLDNQAEILDQHKAYIHPDYLNGFYKLMLSSKQIPSLNFINEQLSEIGWIAAYVNGFVPAYIYTELQANKIFPISRHIRHKRNIGHSASPDMAHDILGHLPMLFCSCYRDYLSEWAKKAMIASQSPLDGELYKLNSELIRLKEEVYLDIKRIDDITNNLHELHEKINQNPSGLSILTRLYVWSIEYGVINMAGSLKIFGAAIMSSRDEINAICNNEVNIEPFTSNMVNIDVDYTKIQPRLFIAQSFSDYRDILNIL